MNITWKIAGQRTERKTYVPDGEDYADWIGQKWGVDPAKVVVLGAPEGSLPDGIVFPPTGPGRHGYNAAGMPEGPRG